MPSPAFALRLFGPLQVLVDGKPVPRPRARSTEWLLALLVLRHGRAVDRAWLAGTLWPESAESQALHNLRNALVFLRKALGREGARLQSPTRDTLTFDLEGAEVDVVRFDAALKAGGEPALQQVVALYTGPLLEGCYEAWVFPERESREHGCLTALETLADRAAERGEHAVAIQHLRKAEEIDPLRDTTARRLMTSLEATGDPAAAIEVYRRLRQRLHETLSGAPDEATTRLFQAIRARARQRAEHQLPAFVAAEHPAAAPPCPAFLHPVSRPPHPISRMIGREQEAGEVREGLAQSRLVTLIGAGGVGKTRLAMEVAARAAEECEGGAIWVELASLAEGGLLLPTLAAALGVRQEGASDAEALLNRLVAQLSERELLLVLDNCEHILDDAAAIVQTLLSRCPHLRVLATSRQRLGLAGEVAWRVPSLAIPEVEQLPADPAQARETALTYPAIRLFVKRAAAARSGFELGSREQVEAVGRICQRLDGIPLAIELVAARIRTLSPAQIAERMDDRFRLLTTGTRGALPRHQTLRALIDWSYEQLPESERILLRRLSVFAGGWTLEAAEAVCGDRSEEWTSGRVEERTKPEQPGSSTPPFTHSSIQPPEVLDVLDSLVDRSLVLAEEQREGLRYRMLETVREYGWERLAETTGEAGGEEAREAQRRHRDYFLRLVETAPGHGNNSERTAWLDRLEQERGNVRAALECCERDAESGELGLRFVVALRDFWAMRGYLSEGRQRAAALLSHPRDGVSARVRADALYASAYLAEAQWDYAEARSLVEEALALYRSEGHAAGIADALNLTANVSSGEDLRARCYEESLAIYRQLGNRRRTGVVLHNIGIQARLAGDNARASHLFEECLAVHREMGDRRNIAITLHSLSYTAFLQGDLAAARALDEESLRLHREIGDRRWELINLQHLGRVWLRMGRLEEARAYCLESLHLQRALWVKQELAIGLQCLGDIAFAHRDWQRAACLYGAWDALDRAYKLVSAEDRPEETRQKIPALRAALGEAAFERAWAKGEALTMEQALAYALEES